MNADATPRMGADGEVAAHANGAVVTAQQLGRRYGDGDTAIDALRSVDLEVEREKLTAVMGPVGLREVDADALLAGLDKPTSGEVFIEGTDISELGGQRADEAASRSTSASSSSSSTCCRC